MTSVGSLSSIKNASNILEAIGENILVADANYNLIWMNPKAAKLLSTVTSYFYVNNVEEMIGKNMNFFHQEKADRSRRIMNKLTDTHSTRINIKDKYIADIIINPVRDEGTIVGYVIMLMDVTTVVEEEERKEQMIQELSAPALHIWDNTLAVPIIGYLDSKLFNIILAKLLKQCEKEDTEYVIIDFSGMKQWDNGLPKKISEMITCLSVMGVECLFAGVKPDLAQCLAANNGVLNVPKFATTKVAIKHIISQ
ncbi:PAS domain-containing protein [Gracilibacillus sp. S3-1-1]|uniref:PAS domain-containing protein n=1 Tax=Gracilibacillus pellucidus TaxID=3095368 RepID=A0ACC6M5X3_9BACI|nr:PAS domain-containing protein [Gracilibacillus sp. S3-1-1]MDX8046365.1 PAS domain-containing protein [Gracilibacillus sp. S3-1-1]